MSKGRRSQQTFKGPKPVVTIRERVLEGEATYAAPQKPQCWVFGLVCGLKVASGVNEGDLVVGIVQHDRIAVVSSGGLLGYVPNGTAQKILQFIRQFGAGDLQGEVLAKEGEAEVLIKLCIY